MLRLITRIAIGSIFLGTLLILFRLTSLSGPDGEGGGVNSSGTPNEALGKSLYREKCILCHGENGKGDGPSAAYLTPRPRDFTAGKFKFRTTESGSIPTDADLERTILSGLHGTAMPDWKPFLHGDSLHAIVQYIKSFSARFTNDQPKPVTIGSALPATAVSITDGKKVFESLQCGTCHGTHGDGVGSVTADLKDDWGYSIKAIRLNEPWTFRGGSTPEDIFTRFITGMDGSPMPSFVGSASEKEMWNLANYVVFLGRKPVWDMNGDEVKTFYAEEQRNGMTDRIKRGKYLVETHGCDYCHSPVNADGSLMEELRFAGGQKNDVYPFGIYYSYNLTSDKETGLGNWTDEQIKNSITKGIAGKGWRMLPFPMPWTGYAQLSDDDVNAITAFLRTLPPVHNKIPEPEHLNFFSYLWGKFKFMILKEDIPGKVYPGNWGTYTKPDVSLYQNHAPDEVVRKEAKP